MIRWRYSWADSGTVARRIKFYVEEGEDVSQGAEFGFIKFGSQVDLFLPLHAIVEVTQDKSQGQANCHCTHSRKSIKLQSNNMVMKRFFLVIAILGAGVIAAQAQSIRQLLLPVMLLR